MKFLTKNIILFIFIILVDISGYCDPEEGPPQPQVQNEGPEVPPEGPIDNNLTLLALAGILFGLHTIHKHKANKKRPI